VTGQPCNAHPVWERDEAGVKTRPTRYCYRHHHTDSEWREKAAKGGRATHGERLYRKQFVDPDRARELLRVVVATVNESYTLEAALTRLTPFFAQTEADIALLAGELRKLKTLSEIREERRIEHNTGRILRLSEGLTAKEANRP
jgi:hypothetical protein